MHQLVLSNIIAVKVPLISLKLHRDSASIRAICIGISFISGIINLLCFHISGGRFSRDEHTWERHTACRKRPDADADPHLPVQIGVPAGRILQTDADQWLMLSVRNRVYQFGNRWTAFLSRASSNNSSSPGHPALSPTTTIPVLIYLLAL